MKAIEAKIVVLGSQGVGKTSLIERYITKLYLKEVTPTIAASFFICKVTLNGVKVKMQIWDTAGQERFRAMAPMYYRNANAALLIFDISSYRSFVDIKTWVQELQKNVQEPMILTLIGNKCDLDENRSVSREEAFLFATSIGGHYFETSTIREQGIEQVFITTALGLIRLADSSSCTSLKRYESLEQIPTSISMYEEEHSNSINLGIGIDATSDEANAIGRLETPSWSIDHIAHGYPQPSGWCCY